LAKPYKNNKQSK